MKIIVNIAITLFNFFESLIIEVTLFLINLIHGTLRAPPPIMFYINKYWKNLRGYLSANIFCNEVTHGENFINLCLKQY